MNYEKKIRIKDFIVIERPEKDKKSYIIKQFKNTREQNLEILKLLKEILEMYPNLTDKQKIAYCKTQRNLIKLYLKKVQERE